MPKIVDQHRIASYKEDILSSLYLKKFDFSFLYDWIQVFNLKIKSLKHVTCLSDFCESLIDQSKMD